MSETRESGECKAEGVLRQRCEEAVVAIQAVLNEHPRDRFQIVDFGECTIVRLRDCLIAQLREAPDSAESLKLRRDLDQVNIALSLVVGVEYPGAGIQQEPLEQARAILEFLRF